MQLKIDALKQAAAWPDADRRTPVVLASQLMAAELYQEGFDYFSARSASTPTDALSLPLAQGYDFSDFAFVVTAEGIVAIDAASTPEHAASALRDLREITELPITHVILTHAHWDHIGGLDALTTDGATVIAQANFPDELRHQNSGSAPFRYFLPGGRSHRAQVVPDHLVSEPEKLAVGGVEFMLIPIAGGETHDGLIIHVPDRDVVFTGDMSMPYLGAPFFAEGSAEGLFDAMETVMALRPRLLIHGHAGLTDAYTIEAFPGLLAAFRDLDDPVRPGITDALTLVEILQLNHLPEGLKDHPLAVIPYLVTRDHFIQRVHRQRTGYWHPRGEGVEHFTPAELAAAADLPAAGTAAAFLTAGAELTRRGEHALALRILDLGLLSHP